MEAFVERALDKIREAAGRKDRALREECDRVTGEIAAARAAGGGRPAEGLGVADRCVGALICISRTARAHWTYAYPHAPSCMCVCAP